MNRRHTLRARDHEYEY